MIAPNIAHGSGSAASPIEPPSRPLARDREEKAPAESWGALKLSDHQSVGTTSEYQSDG
jgi:hypothetical protein